MQDSGIKVRERSSRGELTPYTRGYLLEVLKQEQRGKGHRIREVPETTPTSGQAGTMIGIAPVDHNIRTVTIAPREGVASLDILGTRVGNLHQGP